MRSIVWAFTAETLIYLSNSDEKAEGLKERNIFYVILETKWELN